MNKIKLITMMSAIIIPLTACSNNNIDEPTARLRLNEINEAQKQANFLLPIKGTIVLRNDKESTKEEGGETVNEKVKESLLVSYDKEQYYLHTHYISTYSSVNNFEQFYFLKEGVFYKAEISIKGSFYMSDESISGKEIDQLLIDKLNEIDFYDVVLGEKEKKDGYELLDIFANGKDAYRDSLKVGTEVEKFSFDLKSDKEGDVSLNDVLKTDYDVTKEGTRHVFLTSQKENINFVDNLLSSYMNEYSLDEKIFYDSELIYSSSYYQKEEKYFYQTVDEYIPDLSTFTFKEVL